MQTLGSSNPNVGTVAGQIIAALANIELPHGQWEHLIPSLLEKLTQTTSVVVKKSTLQCIGFVCEAVVLLNFDNSNCTFIAI